MKRKMKANEWFKFRISARAKRAFMRFSKKEKMSASRILINHIEEVTGLKKTA